MYALNVHEQMLWRLLLFVCEVYFLLFASFVHMFVCQDGWTPLHRASYGGHIEVVRLLLDRGAHIQAQAKVSAS